MPGASYIALLQCWVILGIAIQHATWVHPKIECVALPPRWVPQIAHVSNKQGDKVQITGGHGSMERFERHRFQRMTRNCG